MHSFNELKFPLDGEYSSDEGPLPIEFFFSVFPSSKEAYFKLGYFSSSAIQVLAYGFAQFIANGGSLQIVTNHFIYEKDLDLLDNGNENLPHQDQNQLLRDPKWLYERLSSQGKHFLDCLKVLASCGRLKIVPVMLKPAKMVHYKEGVFIDDLGNKISFTGSCNFTGNGLVENAESISINRSWVSEEDESKCQKKKLNIISIINKCNEDFVYLSPNEVLDAALSLGKDKSIEELLLQERGLIREADSRLLPILKKYETKLEASIKAYRLKPRFPYITGPRQYQIDAYEAWKNNNDCGIFAMATGTGKTITSLNCLLNIFNLTGVYQAVILVPTKALITQWQTEIASFNFNNVYSAYSGNPKWVDDLSFLITNLSFDQSTSFILLSTYDTVVKEKLLKKIPKLPSNTVLIADEAHNFGREGIKKNIESFPFKKRLALSATPKRRFDEEGNKLIEDYFRDCDPYIYSFSMERAIDEGVLCPYEYIPHVVELTPEETITYSELSAKLTKLYDHTSGEFFNPELAKILLLERRRVIHKASNKLDAFAEIVADLEKQKKLSFCFVYTPEGEDLDGENLLESYMDIFHRKAPNMRAHHYTSSTESRAEVMLLFEDEFYNTLFSMKCLDEGVDIPRAEVAIFCSSTGNPRQFIQRRGRVLRQHPKKTKAIIHDLVVIPNMSGSVDVDQALERKLITDELIRVVYFASLSRNYYETMKSLNPIAERFKLNLYALQLELAEAANG